MLEWKREQSNCCYLRSSLGPLAVIMNFNNHWSVSIADKTTRYSANHSLEYLQHIAEVELIQRLDSVKRELESLRGE